MNDQTPDALICSTSEGHASIAAVLRESVSELGFHAQEAKFIDPIMSIYRWAYREAPWFCRYFYHLVNQPWAPAVAY